MVSSSVTATAAPGTVPARVGFLDRLHSPGRPVLVFDGATGTSLQLMDLGPEDFGGPALEGCNENLVSPAPTWCRRCIVSFWRRAAM